MATGEVLTKAKILVIDDEPILRQTFKKALSDQNFQLFFAENGEQGLELFKQEAPTLIFLDLRMPVMSGFEFLKAVRIKPPDHFTVVAITGHGGDDDIEKAYQLGVHCFLRKPLSMVELVSLSHRCIMFKEMEQERERLIAELEHSLATINTLQSILPICSSCKKIRDQEDKWADLETYIRQHTDTEFTHGICPECVQRLYPEFANEIINSTKK